MFDCPAVGLLSRRERKSILLRTGQDNELAVGLTRLDLSKQELGQSSVDLAERDGSPWPRGFLDYEALDTPRRRAAHHAIAEDLGVSD
jgi:hypothetical protein